MLPSQVDGLFRQYLTLRYPGCLFELETLTGGVVNHTVRARRLSSSVESGTRPGQPMPASLVLKHAPPHLAGDATSPLPFPQGRQLVEAAALRLFEPENGTLADLPSSARVRVPKVIGQDPALFVLALEDFGPLISLYDFFTPTVCDTVDIDRLLALAIEIGRRAGTFFAGLHEPQVVSRITTNSSEAAILHSTLTEELIYSAAVKETGGILHRHGGLDARTAETLGSRVKEDFRRETGPDEAVFQIGDCHPGCILVSDPRSAPDCDPAIIDWEFSTTKGGRGINGDMAQFLAVMHNILLSQEPRSNTYQAADVFTSEMCMVYAQRSRWAGKLMAGGLSEEKNIEAATVLRSAMILHGREMINQVNWVEAFRNSPNALEIVRSGAWYIQRAGDNIQDLVSPENWEALLREKEHGKWPVMRSLFRLANP